MPDRKRAATQLAAGRLEPDSSSGGAVVRADARQAFELVHAILERIESRLTEIEQRLGSIEDKLGHGG
jgi:hypothetical protein